MVWRVTLDFNCRIHIRDSWDYWDSLYRFWQYINVQLYSGIGQLLKKTPFSVKRNCFCLLFCMFSLMMTQSGQHIWEVWNLYFFSVMYPVLLLVFTVHVESALVGFFNSITYKIWETVQWLVVTSFLAKLYVKRRS